MDNIDTLDTNNIDDNPDYVVKMVDKHKDNLINKYNYYYINNNNIVVDFNRLDNNICICNPKNTPLDKLILFYCYLYQNCELCFRNIHCIGMCKEKSYKEIQKMIKENPKNILFNKNHIGFYPLTFVKVLHHILIRDYEYDESNKYNRFNKENQMYLAKIKTHIIDQYVKKDAFEYIKKSSIIGIGNNTKLFQLPYELWEHIFTFI